MAIEPIIFQLNLGQPIAKYQRPSLTSAIKWGLALGIPWLILGLALFIATIVNPGDYDDGTDKLVLYLCVLPSLLLVGLSLLQIVLYRRDGHILYEQGLIDVFNGKARGMRYDYITEVNQKYLDTSYQGSNPFSTFLIFIFMLLSVASPGTSSFGGTPIYLFRFRDRNGTTISSKNQEFSDRVKAEVYKHLLPQIIRTYESGNEVKFGQLSLSAQGLKTSKERLSWSGPWTIEAESIAAQNTSIVIKRVQQSGWFSKNPIVLKCAMDKIVNFDIFWNLVTHLHENQGKLQRDYLHQLLESTLSP
jgi:hypothetical protein